MLGESSEKRIRAISVVALFILALAFALFFSFHSRAIPIVDFDSCVKAGNPILETYPEQCRFNAKTFVKDDSVKNPNQNVIRVISPQPGQKISSPFEIRGEARGQWFFEGSFPFLLQDSSGGILFEGVAQARGEWMTTQFVSFTAKISFEKPTTNTGTLILKKDNPSGLLEHDQSFSIPVTF